VAAGVVTAVTTAGEEETTEGAAAQPTGSVAPTSVLDLSADPTGKLAFDEKQATVGAGRLPIRLVNNSSSLPHNLTIAKGAKVLVQTKTVSGGSATTTANLAPGEYVFYSRSTRTAPRECRAC
jgi:plastocyanin